MPAIPQARKQPRQARSRHAVAAILEAAARILARDGYAGLTTNKTAELAGVGIGSLYQYFPNKDALVLALHLRELGLHRVLEREWPAFDEPPAVNPQDAALRDCVAAWLAGIGADAGRAEVLLRMADGLIHGLLLDAEPPSDAARLITDALAACLGLPAET